MEVQQTTGSLIIPTYLVDSPADSKSQMADAMSTPFLNNVASHRLHESTSDLVSLLREKIRLAPDRVFNMYKDLQFCTMDVIWAATFGTELGISKSQAEYLSRLDQIELPGSADGVVQFPENELPEVWHMLARIMGSCEVVMTSPLGRWHHREFSIIQTTSS